MFHAILLSILLSLAAALAVPAAQNPNVAATVDSEAISISDVDSKIGPALLKVRASEYAARRHALMEIINGKLLQKEAAAAGLSSDALLRREVEQRLPPQTVPLAEPDSTQTDRRIEETAARASYFRELRRRHHVIVTLPPPRVAIAPDIEAPRRGARNAAIVITEFADFQCPSCARLEPTLLRLIEAYPDKITIVFRDLPIPSHTNAFGAARAARCAALEGKFWAMHDLLFQHHENLSTERLLELANIAEVDEQTFIPCFSSNRVDDAIYRDVRAADELGVSGTPALFVNGIPIANPHSYADLVEIIDEELSKPDSRSSHESR